MSKKYVIFYVIFVTFLLDFGAQVDRILRRDRGKFYPWELPGDLEDAVLIFS